MRLRKKLLRKKLPSHKSRKVLPILYGFTSSSVLNHLNSGKFYRWTEIEAFHYVRKKNIDLRDEISYRGKVKLHGTNAAVAIENNGQQIYAQSRNMFISEENDHHGFLAFVNKYQQYFRSLVAQNPIAAQKDLVIFGEVTDLDVLFSQFSIS
jgi:hypothetical protein